MSHKPTADSSAQFLDLLRSSLEQNAFVKLVLGKYCGEEQDLERIVVRQVMIKDQPQLSFVYRYKNRDITKNYPTAVAIEMTAELLGASFKNAHLLTLTLEHQLAFSKKGKASVFSHKVSHGAAAPSQEHDREKQRFVDLNRPFLVDLGVTNTQHQLIPAMSRKWKQINKFIEVFRRAFEASHLSAAKAVQVVDFGSGKGYLTFAIHDFLHNTLGLPAQVTGVELRDDLVQLCNKAAERLQLAGLHFRQGDVRSYTPESLDVMIALHACDIATDHAIHMGIRSEAAIIMCAPCCHKQLRPQMRNPEVLQPMLQYGVHLGQEAEMVTDSLRALLLEAYGYETQVFEFVSLEHTSKNKMILAVKRANPIKQEKVLTQIQALKDFYGIKEQCLETLLLADGS
ncbi:MAG: SAM-dependent methyltransferase [Gammaproteobacteria bacterium]|nr:SAM-dependent methyltransferase [Gammaproteobacteria bacterium]